MTIKLHYETSLFQAALTLLKIIDESLPPDENVNCYIFGGIAVHLYTGARSTTDMDMEFSRRIIVERNIITLSERDRSDFVYMDTQFNPIFALIHEYYQVDALFIPTAMTKICLYVINPVDLAVSKLSRFSDIDQADIVALARHGLIDAWSLENRARQALSRYIGDTRNIETNLSHAMNAVLA